jgi:hypothetical protein
MNEIPVCLISLMGFQAAVNPRLNLIVFRMRQIFKKETK